MKISTHSRMLGIAVLFSATLLAGCATRQEPLYYWGNYQATVYSHFKGDKGPEQEIIELEKVLEEARAKGKAVPPGFKAHLAMLYGQTGRSDRLIQNLEEEKQQFPESTTFMEFILKKFKPS